MRCPSSSLRADVADPEEPLAVPWDEAREVLAVVLVVAAALYVCGPLVRYLAADTPFGFWDDLRVILSNINISSGLLLVGAAVTVCTTPRADMVPGLRRAVSVVATIVTVFGIVAIINVLTATTADDSVALRIAAVMLSSGPGTLLAGTAAWLVDRVDVLPPPG